MNDILDWLPPTFSRRTNLSSAITPNRYSVMNPIANKITTARTSRCDETRATHRAYEWNKAVGFRGDPRAWAFSPRTQNPARHLSSDSAAVTSPERYQMDSIVAYFGLGV
jgi:hypothetical protein